MSRSALVVIVVAAIASLTIAPGSAAAATSMTLVGSSVTILGDAAPEVLVIEDVAGMLQHNRATDPGYNSAADFDSAAPGDQTLAASALSTISVQLAGGPNTLIVKDGGIIGRTWSIGSSTIAAPIATIAYDGSVSGLTVQGGAGVDTLSILASSAATPITLETGAGADNVSIGSAAGTLAPIMGAVRIGGGASTDAVVLNDAVGTANVIYRFDQEPGRSTLTRTVPSDAGAITWDGAVATLTLNAGTGSDQVELIAPPATPTVINVSLGRGNDTFEPRGSTNLGGGTLSGGEDTSATSTDSGDELDLRQQSSGVTLDMASGTPGAYGPMSGFELIVGTPSSDVLRGSSGAERFNPGSGDDVVSGGDGDDRFYSNDNDGNDTYAGGAGTDTFDATTRRQNLAISLDGVANDGAPKQLSNVGSDIEVVITGDGDDRLVGSDVADTLSAGGGLDMITGGLGNDTLRGGGGSDVFIASTKLDGADTVTGGAGPDVVDYARRRTTVTIILDLKANDGARGERDLLVEVERIVGGRGNDQLTGDRGGNQLWGGPGNDVLRGGGGADTLDGDAGNDQLDGGLGKDRLSGGAGMDMFRTFDRARDTIDGGLGRDIVIRRDAFDVIRRVP